MDDRTRPSASPAAPLAPTRAMAYAALAVIASGAGVVVSWTQSPLRNTAPLVLEGRERAPGLAEAAAWELALIAGHGTALLLCTVLARAVFSTAAAQLLARRTARRRRRPRRPG